MNDGSCDICGEYSTKLIDGICQKQVCQRYIEENKAIISEQLAQTDRLANEYGGQGYE